MLFANTNDSCIIKTIDHFLALTCVKPHHSDEKDKLEQEVGFLRSEMDTMRADIEQSRDLTHQQRIRALDLKYELQAVSMIYRVYGCVVAYGCGSEGLDVYGCL